MMTVVVSGKSPVKYAKSPSGVVFSPYLRQNASVLENYKDNAAASFFDGEGGKDEFSYSVGSFFRNLQRNRNKRIAQRQKTKQAEAQAQSDTAAAIAKSQADDAALAQALTPAPKADAGKSHTGLYIGIGVGVLVLGIGGYLWYKHSHKK